MSILRLESLSMAFGGLRAVDHLSFEVERGEIVGLIGPNGSGKTTTINCVSGFHRPTGGRVYFKNKDVTGSSPNRMAAEGLCRTFQVTSLLPDATVMDNVMVGLHLRANSGLLDALLRLPASVVKEKKNRERAEKVAHFLGLDGESRALCANVSHYTRKKLGLAIALASEPEMILVDEVVSGLSNEEAVGIVSAIESIRQSGTTVLLVEHNMKVVMGLCDRIVVLNFGAKICEGTPADIQADDKVRQAYLGCEYA